RPAGRMPASGTQPGEGWSRWLPGMHNAPSASAHEAGCVHRHRHADVFGDWRDPAAAQGWEPAVVQAGLWPVRLEPGQREAGYRDDAWRDCMACGKLRAAFGLSNYSGGSVNVPE